MGRLFADPFLLCRNLQNCYYISQVLQTEQVVQGATSSTSQVVQDELQPEAKITVPITRVARMILRSMIFLLKM